MVAAHIGHFLFIRVRWSGRLSSLGATAFLLLAPSLTHSALPDAATNDTWIEASTSRFLVCSNAGEQEAKRTARHLERLATSMERIGSGLQFNRDRRVSIVLFRDAGSFAPYVRGKDEYGSTVGYHVKAADTDLIATYVTAGSPSMDFVSHEFTHAVIHRTIGVLPVWADEGLAEYFSTSELKSSRAIIGRSKPSHREWLRTHSLPLRSLFLISHDSPEYSGGEHRQTLYAQSWAVVHMLMMDELDEGKRFDVLLSSLGSGVSSAAALSSIYGPNAIDSLENELRRFITDPMVRYMSFNFETPFEKEPAAVRTLDHTEALTLLGGLLSHADRELSEQAEAHLRAAWNSDSLAPLAGALLGELCERLGRDQEADRWFDRVGHSSAPESRAFGIAGDALAERSVRHTQQLHWPAPGAGKDAIRARALLTKALSAEPDNSVWLADYGLTFLEDSVDVASAIGALILAHESWPRRSDIAGAQSIMNLRAGNRASAVAMYHRIPPGPDQPRWRYLAGRLIADADRSSGAALHSAGRGPEAESVFVRLKREVKESGVAEMCDSWLGAIRKHRAADSSLATSGIRDRTAKSKGSQSRQGGPSPSVEAHGESKGKPSVENGLTARGDAAYLAGDYSKAELEFARASSRAKSASTRSYADSMVTRARNLRRIRDASGLLSSGMAEEACRLLDLVLSERPAPDLEREARRLKKKSCSAWW